MKILKNFVKMKILKNFVIQVLKSTLIHRIISLSLSTGKFCLNYEQLFCRTSMPRSKPFVTAETKPFCTPLLELLHLGIWAIGLLGVWWISWQWSRFYALQFILPLEHKFHSLAMSEAWTSLHQMSGCKPPNQVSIKAFCSHPITRLASLSNSFR